MLEEDLDTPFAGALVCREDAGLYVDGAAAGRARGLADCSFAALPVKPVFKAAMVSAGVLADDLSCIVPASPSTL